MEKEYVQAEAYAEPVTYGEVVTAEPIMGEVVGVMPPTTDHLPEALDGAPRLVLVPAGSADALRFDHAGVLREGGEAPLSAGMESTSGSRTRVISLSNPVAKRERVAY